MFCLLMSGCNSSNRHSWLLPNHERIEYHEGTNDVGFTANIPQYVSWISEKKGTNSLLVGIGGSYRALTFHLNQSQTLGWITGQYAGSEREFYVAIIDLKNFQIADGDCMSGYNLDSVEIKHKSEVEQSLSNAIVIPEHK